MKLLHLGDLHIGKALGEFSLIEDQRYALLKVLETAKDKQVDGVLIAGDVYDKTVPSEEAVRLFDYFLCQLNKLHIKTFIISGNHDSDERLGFGSSLFKANGIYICTKYDGTLYKQELTDENGIVNIYLLPFVKASVVKHFFKEEEISSYDSAVRTIISKAEINENVRNIIVAHQFVAGRGEEPALGGSESAAVQNVGLVEKVGADCFDSFDYVALGHIHSPQRVGREEVRYSGSLLKYSLSEVNNEKSVPIITMGKKGEVSIELVRFKPLRDLRHIKGKLVQLLDKANIEAPEDYIYATLTDEDAVNDAMSIMQQYYNNTVKLDYDNAHTREAGQTDFSGSIKDKPFSELITDFYRQIYGCEISEQEMKVMRETAEEAGVTNEAD